MPVDSYSRCPGGTGKKIKFCCPDLLGELDKIERMVDGGQRQAALDYLESLDAKYPGRACLLTTKVLLQEQLGRGEAARQTVDGLLAAQPKNPVALAESALLRLNDGEVVAAVKPMQEAIAASGTNLDSKVFNVISALATTLAAEGYVGAALAHLSLQLQIFPECKEALSLLIRLSASHHVPFLAKCTVRPCDSCPGASPHKGEFDAALRTAEQAHWLDAETQFRELAERAPELPAVWRNLGLLRAYLADEEGAADALRRFAALDVPLDDAVEAETLAQALDRRSFGGDVDQVAVTFPVLDFDAFEARLARNRQLRRLAVDAALWHGTDQPPPRATYLLLDRPMPESGVDIADEAVPEVLGNVLLFGRETDRQARVEMGAARGELAAAGAALAAVAGDALGPASGEEVVGHTPALERLMSWHWRLPDDTPPERIEELTAARRRKLYVERWPQAPNPLFDGRTPLEAAADPALRVKLLAAVLYLETSSRPAPPAKVIDELRAKLGLPAPEPIDPATVDVQALPLTRLVRLMVEKLSDDDLMWCYQRAMMNRAPALEKLALEVVARPSLKDKVDVAQVYGGLATLTDDFDRALAYLTQARSVARAQQGSTAIYDLEELALRLEHGEFKRAVELAERIQREHGREPGVVQQLVRIFYEAGLIDERGRPAAVPTPEPAGIVVPGGSTAAAGKLWTPDSESGTGKKTALWTPGME